MRSMGRAFALFLIPLCLFSTAAGPATSPASPEQARQKFDALLRQGMDALAAKQPEAALAVYLDAKNIYDRHLKPKVTTGIDDDQVAVLHGLAIAYQLLDKPEKATPLFDANSTLDRACAAKTAPRQLLLTRGALDCTQGFLAMRTVVRISQYLKDHPDELDSELLDVFLTALIKSEDRVTNRALTLDPSIKLYEQLNAKLEETRPGQKRYGIKWVTPTEYTASMSARKAAIKDYETAVQRADDAAARVKSADRHLDSVRGSKDRAAINSASNALAAARNRAADANKAVVEAKAKIPPVPVLAGEQLDQLMLPHAVTIVSTSTGKTTAPAERIVLGGDIIASQPKSTPTATTPVAQVNQPREFLGEQRKRTFTRSAAGFAVGPDLVVTSAAAVKDATHITLESADAAPLEGTVERATDTLALIRLPKQKMAWFNLAQTFEGGPIKCRAFPEVSVFGVSLEEITGSATAPKEGWTVTLQKHARLSGAPLLNSTGDLIGIELTARDDNRERTPAMSAEAIRQFLGNDLPANGSPNPTSGIVFQITASYEK